MSKLKIVLNKQEVRNMLRSKEMMNICKEHAQKAQSKLGDGYEVKPYTGANRVNVSLSATTKKAQKENHENNTILKALGGLK